MSTRVELDVLLAEAEAFVSQFITRAIAAASGRVLPEHTAGLARHWNADAFAAKPNPQQAVNKYQLELQKAYTNWYEDTADELAEADEDEQEEIWAAALLALLALLKKMGRDGLADAVELALGDEESFPELDDLLDDQVAENDKYLTKSLIPDLRALGLLVLGAGASAEAIGEALAGQTARVGSYSGEWWDAHQKALGEVAKKKGKAVLWFLDPNVKNHCSDCPQYGDDDGRYYSSMEVLLDSTGGATPANGVECGANCRCSLMLVEPRENNSHKLKLEKFYDPDHPRDDQGRFGSGGSGAEKVKTLSNDDDFFGSDKEKAYIYSEDGKLIAEIQGDASEINLSGVSASETKDSHFIHNHPSGDLEQDTWTFSEPDIQAAIDGDFSSITATGKYKTYTLTRPPGGWPKHEDAMRNTQQKLKISDSYLKDFIQFRDGKSFGDSPKTLNKESKKFWNTYAKLTGATYTETKREK